MATSPAARGSKILFGMGLEQEFGVPALVSSLIYPKPTLPIAVDLTRSEGASAAVNPGGFVEKGIPGPVTGVIDIGMPMTASTLLEVLEHMFGGVGVVTKTNPETGVYKYVYSPDLDANETSFHSIFSKPPVEKMRNYGMRFSKLDLAIANNAEIAARLAGIVAHGTRLGASVASGGNSGTHAGPVIRGVIADDTAGDIWVKCVAVSAVATGTITFADLPTANDTITLNGIVCKFTASSSDATATGTAADPVLIQIKADLALTLDETILILNDANMPAAAKTATYTEDGTDTLTITYDQAGTSGNAFTLAASSDTVSAATLTSGATPTFQAEQSSGTPASYAGSNQSILVDSDYEGDWQNLVGGSADADLGIWGENKDPLEVIFYGAETVLDNIAAGDEWYFPVTWSDPTPTYLTAQRFTSAHLKVERRDIGASTWELVRVLSANLGLEYPLEAEQGNYSKYAFELDRSDLWMPTIALTRRFRDLVWAKLMDSHTRSELQLSWEGQQIGTTGTYREGFVWNFASVGMKSNARPAGGVNAIEEAIELAAETNDAGDVSATCTVYSQRDWTPSV